MRERIYRMVHVYDGSRISVIYKYFMIFIIIISLIPLTFKENYLIFRITDTVCLAIYAIDYALRFITADYKFGKHHWTSFARYPLRLISIIDLLSVFAVLSSVLGLPVEIFRILNFRVIRIFRYSKSIRTIVNILRRAKKSLLSVATLAFGYIFISAILMFNTEPDIFESFTDAIYWATISLTTVGYGDISPVTQLGKALAALSSFAGVAIVALPASIVTAEYINSLAEKNSDKKD